MAHEPNPGGGQVPPEPRSPVDPRLEWAIATEFRYLRAGRWLPLLVEFDASALVMDVNAGLTPLQQFTGLEWLDPQVRDAVRVPELFVNPPRAIKDLSSFPFCGLLIDRARAAEVVADAGWLKTIVDSSLGPPTDLDDAAARNPAFFAAKSASAMAAAGPVPRVAIAVIDEGIAVAHERFLDASGARIAHFWNMNGGFGTSLGFGMPGTELTAADIDAAIAAHSGGGRVDEEAVYEALGLLDYLSGEYKALAHRRSHGSHVLDLAGGAVYDGSRPLIGVELPESAVADPVGSPLYLYILLGILFVLDRADQIRAGQTLPVVLNISYGPHQGPHDGSSLFERAVDALIVAASGSDTPLDVLLAAGNFRQARVHARFPVAPGTSKRIEWRVQPEDRTPSFVDLWLQPGAGAGISVKVESPRGTSVTVSAASPLGIYSGPKGEEFRARYVAPTFLQPRAHVDVILQGTATDPPLHPTQATAPAGLWSIDVTNASAAAVQAESWIWRDGPVTGRRPHGRQSYFDDPAYTVFDPYGFIRAVDPVSNPSYVSRARTLSGIATGEHPFVVGGYRRLVPPPDFATPALYSSLGPVSGGPRTRPDPDVLAPSEDSIALHGVLGAGTRSGSVVSMNGTSVAAPQFARWLAGYRQSGMPVPPLTGAPLYLPFSRIPR